MSNVAYRFIKEAFKNNGVGFGGMPALIAGSLIYPQPNNYACGPMALRHCLLKWDVDVDLYRLIELGHVTRAGTTERQLELMMWHAGSAFKHFDLSSAMQAKEKIDFSLNRGKALILCVEGWQHWIACLGHSRSGYLIFDSSRPGPVIKFRSWKWLRNEMRHVPKGATKASYSIISVGRPVHWLNE